MARSDSIQPQPLTRESFKPFGDVIEVASGGRPLDINEGYTRRYNNLASVDVLQNGGIPLINIFRSKPLPQPIVLKKMERHPLSSQAFMPLGDQPYLVVVAAAGDFAIENIRVFLANSNQGVNYHRGTWHHYCLALNQESDFLVIDRGQRQELGDLIEDNCDEILINPRLEVSLRNRGNE